MYTSPEVTAAAPKLVTGSGSGGGVCSLPQAREANKRRRAAGRGLMVGKLRSE
jgi:hypothetical protein